MIKMLIRVNGDVYGEIPYQVDKKNVSEVINEIDFNPFDGGAAKEDKGSAFEFYKKLMNIFEKEKRDWGKKDVYLSFDEAAEVITTTFQSFNYNNY
jgi:hypothetical protein